MSSRIGKKTYTSPEYAARQLAYCKVPLLKVERPLKFIIGKAIDALPKLPRDADVHAINQQLAALKRMLRYPRTLAKYGHGGMVQAIALRQA